MAMITNPLPWVMSVRHVRNHVLRLRFADGVEGEVDFAGPLDGHDFEPLRDVHLFAQAKADGGIVVWPNGADSAPEALYARVLAAKGIPLQSIDDAWAAQLATIAGIPEISRFFGIVISMLADDHSPPHFHARYGEYAISVVIRDGEVVGKFPQRGLRLVEEWRERHRLALEENWRLMRSDQPPNSIPPLD